MGGGEDKTDIDGGYAWVILAGTSLWVVTAFNSHFGRLNKLFREENNIHM